MMLVALAAVLPPATVRDILGRLAGREAKLRVVPAAA